MTTTTIGLRLLSTSVIDVPNAFRSLFEVPHVLRNVLRNVKKLRNAYCSSFSNVLNASSSHENQAN